GQGQGQWRVGVGAEYFYEFVAGHFRSGYRSDSSKAAIQSDFLSDFANGAFHIAFTGINMASSAGIPLARKIFLSMRSLLQKQFAQAVKDENVHSTMIEIFPMDCFSVKRSECLIALIDHRQALVR